MAHTLRILALSRSILALLIVVTAQACSYPLPRGLPSTSELEPPPGLQIARVSTHLHSVYSHDACDSEGIVDGVLDESCVRSLKQALCTNRITTAFLTDHPRNMVDYEFSDLILFDSHQNEEVILSGADPIGNTLFCENGHTARISVGVENQLMALGLEAHTSPDPSTRLSTYTQTDAGTQALLRGNGALIAIPHPEKFTSAELQALTPDIIEIYNFHANADPKIRRDSLGLDPFGGTLRILLYAADYLRRYDPDLAIFTFYETPALYFDRWDDLLANGVKVKGIFANDAHEYLFPLKAFDGERLDSYRRVTKWFTNHLLVADDSLATVKTALGAGRGWMVAEAIGPPVGMDFFATQNATRFNPGDDVTLANGSTTITIRSPRVHPNFQIHPDAPTIETRLYRIDSTQTTLVASIKDDDLTFTVSQTGTYRAEIFSTLDHFQGSLPRDVFKPGDQKLWIATQPIHIE